MKLREGFAVHFGRFSFWERALPTNRIEIWAPQMAWTLEMRKPFVPAKNSRNTTRSVEEIYSVEKSVWLPTLIS
jgi:hypothetical protein